MNYNKNQGKQNININKSPINLVIGSILTIVLIGFLIINFFVTPNLTKDQASILKLIYPLLAGLSASILGGEAAFRLSTISKGYRIGFSATAGIAVFVFLYLNPPSYLSSQDGPKIPHVLVIDSFVRRYDQNSLLTNADQIENLIREINPELEPEHILVAPNFDKQDDVIRRKPNLIIIHLSSFFASTNKSIDINEFAKAMEELNYFLNYILKNSKSAKVLIYTRKTPESGLWTVEIHKAVIEGVNRIKELSQINSDRLSMIELPWDAKFTNPDVKAQMKKELRIRLSEL